MDTCAEAGFNNLDERVTEATEFVITKVTKRRMSACQRQPLKGLM